MQVFFTLLRRELATFLVSMTGYVILAVATFLMGLSFSLLLAKLQMGTPDPITELFFQTPFFWFILLLLTPMITMRTFAQEKYSGTFETLMTTPVSDGVVVAAKFAAALIFHLLTWLPLLGFMLILRRFMEGANVVDWGTIGSTYLGIGLMGSLLVSAGCLASSLTRSQIVAAMLALVFGVALFLLSFVGERQPLEATMLNDALNYVAMVRHIEDFARGVVDTRQVLFYVSTSAFFLFLTWRSVESRRWK